LGRLPPGLWIAEWRHGAHALAICQRGRTLVWRPLERRDLPQRKDSTSTLAGEGLSGMSNHSRGQEPGIETVS